MSIIRRRLQREPQAAAHRGWLAQHGGRTRPGGTEASSVPVEPEVAEFPLAVVAGDGVAPTARDDAIAALRHVCRFAPDRVLRARLTLERHPDPAVRSPAAVSAAVEMRSGVVRAEGAAKTFADAVDTLERRLRRRLEKTGELRKTRRRLDQPTPRGTR